MKKYSNGNGESQVPNIISLGTKVTGEIESDGDVRIDGFLTGKIHAKGKVVIGKDGVVDGEIYCKNTDISGKVNATMEVKEVTVLKATAVFTGKITTSKISIETGALFTGECVMSGTGTAKAKNETKKG
ncbi:polymer-forming cytoskeletal protein [Candidatus Sulfidibacterium hydrothermale]|jgi:cytoskeletal protein CcmA (bactofilin family)|uniref:bactofilin family protein n=1 Tax=Candidatus Sulfidibacterium hydrothermale TaxID=2875962 RepID=UPI001F0B0FE5|nr:polymer-forming cytoskeletal protein [Candidatus Sulfidibacterium hydrothermale]UBM62697.1 polymer-forming cytoskeletal protein [Candidatus Sulfidibacterium hydrothermale]